MLTRNSQLTLRKAVWFGFIAALANLATFCPSATSFAQQTPAAQATNSGVNLAVVAAASTSYVSGNQSLPAINNGYEPKRSRDDSHGAYGNWNRTGTQWVQYDWNQAISTRKIDVYWWADGAGIKFPIASRLKFWNGTDFVLVTNASGLGVARNQYNTTTFDEVRTTKLRLEFDSDGDASTGMLQWKVYDSGHSPKFPPSVVAGVDRVNVLGGKTYLNGKWKALTNANDGAVKLSWSKVSGPGKVKFDDAGTATTAAQFSKVGDYVLKLTASLGSLRSADTLKVKVSTPPPATQLDAVWTKNFKVNSPLWNSRVKALIVNWIPHCIDQMNRTDIRDGAGGIDNFVEAAKALAGQPHARQKGFVFANAWVHQTVEAMSIALMVDPQGDQDIIKAQDKMRATLQDWIPKILSAQEPDGYLQTAYTLRNTNDWPRRWSPESRANHEGYTAGYFIESAINYNEMTRHDDPRMYNAAKKLADCWYDNIGPAPKQAWYDGHEEMEQALVRFGRYVNDLEGGGKGEKYIQLAKFLIDCRYNTSNEDERSQYDQSHLPVVQQYEAVGHAVRAIYLYSGMADVAVETHNTDYQSAVMSLWDNIVNRKYYVTGGIGSGESSEGFGPDYSLRNGSYCESCSSCGEIFFQYKMDLAYQDARYVDLYEETLYNALLGSTDLEGLKFYYTNPLIGGQRTSWHVCPCCVGNIPRTLLMLPTWMYARSKDAIYVNLFIGSTSTIQGIGGTDVEMVQATDYPWSGKVAITVNPAASKRFTVHVRVPNRTTSELYSNSPEVDGLTSISLNGKKLNPKVQKGYVAITRTWKAGDKIELELPMAVQRVKASDKIAADKGLVALRYGPLIYNVEPADQENLNEPIDAKAPLTTEWRGDLLDGVMVIKGRFADGSPLTAIPNYARNNRLSQTAPSNRAAAAGGDSGIDYSGASKGAVASATTNSTPSTTGGGRSRGNRGASSMVWLKDQP